MRFIIFVFLAYLVLRLIAAWLARKRRSEQQNQRPTLAARLRAAVERAATVRQSTTPDPRGAVETVSPTPKPPVEQASAPPPPLPTPAPARPQPPAAPASMPETPDPYESTLSSSIDSSLSTTLGGTSTDPISSPLAGPQIVPLSPELQTRVLELMDQNFEVMAVRLLCDELHVGILDAHKTVRTLAGLPTTY
jgi:hypothetical protein